MRVLALIAVAVFLAGCGKDEPAVTGSCTYDGAERQITDGRWSSMWSDDVGMSYYFLTMTSGTLYPDTYAELYFTENLFNEEIDLNYPTRSVKPYRLRIIFYFDGAKKMDCRISNTAADGFVMDGEHISAGSLIIGGGKYGNRFSVEMTVVMDLREITFSASGDCDRIQWPQK